jgi:heat shock protein HslJ
MRPQIRIGAAVLLAWVSAGCFPESAPTASRAPASVVRTIAYRCPDGTGFRISMAAEGGSVSLDGPVSGPVTLPRVVSASGARYSDGRTTYWSKGSEATLETAGARPRVCTVVADPAALLGTRWRLVRIQSMDGTAVIPEDPSKYTIEFGADGALEGRADCNRIRGRWMAAGDSMTLGPFAMTRAMCPPGSLSDRYVRALESAVTWRVLDGRLTVATKLASGVLHFEAAP